MVKGLLVVKVLYSIVGCCYILPVVALACPLADHDAEDRVLFIIDGDSIVLDKHGQTRLIGINAPEYDEPLGSQAKKSLRMLLEKKRVLVQYGEEKKDSYGRNLVHLHTIDGVNPATEQLTRGYAFNILIPPNDFNAECYAAAEQDARHDNKNIWQDPYYQPRQLGNERLVTGFQRLTGTVTGLKPNSAGVELLTNHDKFRLFISRSNMATFGGHAAIQEWVGEDFIVRGWVSYRKRGNYFSLWLGHPNMVEYIANVNS